jgi:hypothetical protein
MRIAEFGLRNQARMCIADCGSNAESRINAESQLIAPSTTPDALNQRLPRAVRIPPATSRKLAAIVDVPHHFRIPSSKIPT